MAKQEETNIIIKILYLLPSIMVGLLGKYATDITLGKKQSKIKWIAIGILSVCAGIFSAWICTILQITGTKASIIQCTSTLLGEKMILFISLRSGKIAQIMITNQLGTIMSIISNNKKKKEDINDNLN